MNDFSLDPKFAKLTPASFAMYCSGGRWKLARHLALLNRELMNIATGKTKRLMVSMPPRPQPVDTNILMANGRYKPLANIQVGDEVISHKGIKRKVLNVIDAGVQPIITINTSTNIKIKLAESHRVGVEDQGWKEANKIEPGDRLVSLYNIKLENPVSLEPKLAYVLGIFCSLGIRRKGGVSSVCRDYKVMDKYRSEYFYTNEKGTLIFLTKAGEEALRSIGWTEPKRFPSIAWNLDDDTFIPFITGFLITENKPTNILRRDLPVGHLEDASKLLLNYGILSCCSYTNRGSILNIFKKPTVQYIKDIFAQKILTRQNDGPRYISHKITAIESTPPEPCICLEVEEDHSYIADTYVSHNSGKCVAEDQEVFRCDGKAIPIKDIKVGDKVFSVGESNKLHQDTVLHKVESGRKKCCRVTTKNGKSLISSLDHKYLTTRGYTRLEDIKPDEFIAYLDGDKVRWSKVIKLDKLGLRTTYDLQIQDYNNFIANGLVVHNSELVSKYFPAWYLGTFPDKQLIFSTYQAEFAAEFGAAARDLLAEYGEQVFGLNVREGSASASRWRIEDRLGIMQCAGVGGPLTGKGADCLIIDDPIKNDQEAESLVMRNKIFNWFGATAYTRLMPGGSVIIVMTRWHCLLPGTKVLSSKGYINIEDIIEQQEVYGTKGYSKVTGIANKEVKNTCYAFKLFANPDELNVTEDHQIYTNNGWKKAKDITINDKVFCPKPVKKYNNLDFIDFDKQALQDPDFWYCIGLWVAEGSLTYGRKTSSHNSVRYSLHKKEEDIILFVKKTLNKYNINLNYRILKNSLQAKCTDYKFARLVEKFGRGALNKIIPEFVYSLNEECLIQFLKGIYTGDGCLHDRYLRISSSSLSLLQGIRQCLLIIDSPSSIMYTRKNKKIGKAWEIRTVCDKICKVANPINFKSIQVLDTGCYFKIKNIKCFSYEGPVYDIKTESSDFVAEGCLVHNCDDLIGRLLDKVQQEQGEEWKYIKLSAIATEDEPEPPLALGRKRGEALWPEMWPIEKLNSIKNSGAISSYYWSALYQQEPAPEGGGIFKKSSFRYFTQQGDYYILELPNGERKYVEDNKCKKIITVDTANKVTNTSDYTAIGVWAITPDGDILLTHLVRDRIGYADILNKLIYLNSYYRPQFIGIENMGIAIQLITEARLKNLPVKALEPEGKGKQNRANLPMGAVIRMENGKIYFPKHASYLEDIELELLTFPKGKSDEIVDILSYLCNELTKVDMFDNSDFMPYSLEQGLPSGMRKNHGFSF